MLSYDPLVPAHQDRDENLGRCAACPEAGHNIISYESITGHLRTDRSQEELLLATLPLPATGIPAHPRRMTNLPVAGDNYFRTNRSCRLAPAHQSLKIGCIG